MYTVTITVHDDGSPSAHYPDDEQTRNGATDYSVTIEIKAQRAPHTIPHRVGESPTVEYNVVDTIIGSITLYRDEQNPRRMSSCGAPIDGWCSDAIVTWLRTLDRRSYRDAVRSLEAGVGIHEIDIDETEVK